MKYQIAINHGFSWIVLPFVEASEDEAQKIASQLQEFMGNDYTCTYWKAEVKKQ